MIRIVKFATITNVLHLGVGSDELHGSKNSFSWGESFPARSEEQRLLSVRPEHNPEEDITKYVQSQSGENYRIVRL